MGEGRENLKNLQLVLTLLSKQVGDFFSNFMAFSENLNFIGQSEFMEKTFQAAQLTHERFLTIDHSCKIFFDICQTELPQTSGV